MVTLKVSKKMKWFLIGLALLGVAWLLGNMTTWDQPTGFSLLSIVCGCCGCLLDVVMGAMWVTEDFKKDGE